MKRPTITHHAKARMQQRAINELMVQLIQAFGHDAQQSGNTAIRYIPRKRIKALRSAIDNIENVTLVETMEGTVITAMHQTRRIHTKAKAS